MPHKYDNRLTELEIKAAYQEDLLQELNKIVAQQQQQILLLEKTCQLLHERMNSLRTEKNDEAVDQTPPHY
jgi:SlyX protein